MLSVLRVFSVSILGIILFSNALAQEVKHKITSNESTFIEFVLMADENIDSNDKESARQNLRRAESILANDSSIYTTYQAHFNKVYGKIYMQNDLQTSTTYFNRALAQFNDNIIEQSETQMFLGIANLYADNYEIAKMYFEQSKKVFDSYDDKFRIAQVYNNLAVLSYKKGDIQSAIEFCNTAISLNTEIGNTKNRAINEANLDYFNRNLSLSSNKVTVKEFNGEIKILVTGGTDDEPPPVVTSGGGTVSTNPPPVGSGLN